MFQDPIGPCGPLEQSVESFRHSAMAAWSSALDVGAHSVAGRYYGGYTVAIRVVVRMMVVSIGVRIRLRVIAGLYIYS